MVASLAACTSNDNDPKLESPTLATKRAAVFCHTTQSEMQWMHVLIESSKDDPALSGPIYAFRSKGQAIFMHQPWVMSCLACILYDCEGNRLDPVSIDQSVLMQGFQNLEKIYYPELK
jgi:hypothetical protein